ncbi:MAG: Fructokinase (EC [Candidatus Burkholderia crenata]|nr:MAG: Fructokinase (EC [Candidatus Burkholderia crenata]
MSTMTSNSTFPQFVSAGDILTDLIRTGPSDWLSRPGGAGWNVARGRASRFADGMCRFARHGQFLR